jgi:hypothetical protein
MISPPPSPFEERSSEEERVSKGGKGKCVCPSFETPLRGPQDEGVVTAALANSLTSSHKRTVSDRMKPVR